MRLFVLLLAFLAAFPAVAQQSSPPGRFDYYVMALSWSPSYCATKSAQNDVEQCGGGRHPGFVVHGLWPQHDQGGYPAQCALPSKVPAAIVTSMLPIMPSRKLVEHEWKKHGTCMGGGPENYFTTTRDAFQRIRIPASLERPTQPVTLAATDVELLFMAANPGLAADSISLSCKGRTVTEVRVCLDKTLNFRACGSENQDNCRNKVTFPSAR
jgi:ribonuclease T2